MNRGSLRIYLGAAHGVGKTYAMLNEGQRRRARGTDVVVACVDPHGRPATAAQIGELEVVPRPPVDGEDRVCAEMDVGSVVARRPQVALVDELAHRNPPGARNPKRWQDVVELLDAGIDVISTLDIGQLESLSDLVERITGLTQAGTVPDEMVSDATQVELVDATPEALRRRLAHGHIYAADAIDAAVINSFRRENLAALRELTLQWMAAQLDAPAEHRGRPGRHEVWDTRERIVVAISGAPGTERLIRRAARIAHRARGELVGVHVRSAGVTTGYEQALGEHRELVEELGGRYHDVAGADVVDALMDFAQAEQATQIVLGAAGRTGRLPGARASVVGRVLRRSGPIDVHVVSPPPPTGTGRGRPVGDRPGPSRSRPRRRAAATASTGRRFRSGYRRNSALPLPRRLAGWLLVGGGLPVVTYVLTRLRTPVTLSSDLLVYLLFVVVAAAVGGAVPALAAAVGGMLLVNWFFTPPIHTWTIAKGADLLALGVYLGTAAIVSTLVSLAAHRRAEARRANAEAETLAAVASGVIEADPLPVLVAHLRDAFGLDGASLLRQSGGRWLTETAVGAAPHDPAEAAEAHDLGDGLVLALAGPGLAATDRRVLNAFTANLAAALDRRRLHARAAEASILAEANQLRSSLLQAVSHDLRTPLASIKASVSSLRQPDINWTAAESTEFLATIEDETDRLTSLVGNLLDMSRVNANAVAPALSPTALDAVVAAALASLGTKAKVVEADVPEDTPAVNADPALLERVIANLVDNALTYAPDSPVRVAAGSVAGRVLLRVIDQGPGIPLPDRDRVFLSFQRLDDRPRPNRTGVGLGLAVARGFTRAMGADLSIEDTPGGGVTMVVDLSAVETGPPG